MSAILRHRWGAGAALMACAAVWGATFILVKWTVATVDVSYYLFLRFLLATLCLAAVFHRRVATLRWATVRTGIYLGLYLIGGYVAQTEGQRVTTASNTALITGLYILVVPMIARWMFGERVSRAAWLGASISLLGLYLLTNYSFSGFNMGDAGVLLCAVLFAAHIVLVGRAAPTHDAVHLVLVQLAFMTIVCGTLSAWKGTWFTPLPTIAITTIVVNGLFATAAAFVIQTMAQRYVDATRAGIIFALEGLFGTLVACLLGDESLTPLSLLGAVLMLAGVAVAEARHFITAKSTQTTHDMAVNE